LYKPDDGNLLPKHVVFFLYYYKYNI
jgi:hypothetical protein